MTQLDLDAMRDEAISELKAGRVVVATNTIFRFYTRIRELEAALTPFAESWELDPARQFQLPEMYGEAARVLRGES